MDVVVPGTNGQKTQRRSVRADQSGGLLSSQSPGHLGADTVLEAANGHPGQPAKDAVRVPFVETQAEQCLLDPHPIRSGHIGFVGHGLHWGS